jgi:hypothetical protein
VVFLGEKGKKRFLSFHLILTVCATKKMKKTKNDFSLLSSLHLSISSSFSFLVKWLLIYAITFYIVIA